MNTAQGLVRTRRWGSNLPDELTESSKLPEEHFRSRAGEVLEIFNEMRLIAVPRPIGNLSQVLARFPESQYMPHPDD
jgi:hypothetical protein